VLLSPLDMWQLALIAFFAFGTTAYITRRMLMLHRDSSSKLFNLIFWIVFFMPSGWIVGMLLPHSFAIGWHNALLLFIGAILWPIVGLVGFRANKEVDTGFYALFGNIAPLITLVAAVTLLHEVLTRQKLGGIILLILSGVIVAAPLLRQGSHSSRYGLFLCLITVMAGGIGVAYERWMLTRVGLGSYMLFAWTFQALWVAILARSELGRIVHFFKTADRTSKRLVALFGVSNVLRTVCFQTALFLSGTPVDTRRAPMSAGDLSRPCATNRAAAPDTNGAENDVPLSSL